jgi:hypothetical protein
LGDSETLASILRGPDRTSRLRRIAVLPVPGGPTMKMRFLPVSFVRVDDQFSCDPLLLRKEVQPLLGIGGVVGPGVHFLGPAEELCGLERQVGRGRGRVATPDVGRSVQGMFSESAEILTAKSLRVPGNDRLVAEAKQCESPSCAVREDALGAPRIDLVDVNALRCEMPDLMGLH